MADVVILYSGGADSWLMVKLAKMAGKDPYCVLVDYGQKHVKELDYAKVQLNGEKVDFITVTINNFNVDSGLTGSQTEGRWEDVHDMLVPFRNTILISIAAGIAENKDIDEIWYGADYSDRINLFPDCYQEYVVKMNEILAVAGAKPSKLVAPLLGMPKELILEILKNQFDTQLVEMYSGYEEPNDLSKTP